MELNACREQGDNHGLILCVTVKCIPGVPMHQTKAPINCKRKAGQTIMTNEGVTSGSYGLSPFSTEKGVVDDFAFN